MTSAQHAEGRQFDPGQVYECCQDVALRFWGAGGGLWKWCNVCGNAVHNQGGSAWQKYGRWPLGRGGAVCACVLLSVVVGGWWMLMHGGNAHRGQVQRGGTTVWAT